jgi:RNA polymerase sigma factor (TIGR02999 family)
MSVAPGEITRLLADLRQGKHDVESRLADLVYGELHALAQRRMRGERPDHSLQPTVLVNDVFLRLVRYEGAVWTDRKHFYAVAATLMRRILIDHARRTRAVKRGSGRKTNLDDAIAVTDQGYVDLLALDEALTRLSELDARQSRIVELRFFAGLSEDEIADVLGIGLRTVQREWKTARAWLHSQIAESGL